MKISVITAVRNGADTLPAMLASLSCQSHADLEHVVQDGASTDATLAVLAQRGLADMRLVSQADGGIYAAINAGIARARGDVIGLLHADDMLAGPDVLAWVAQALADPALDGVYGDLQYVARHNPARVIRHWTAGPYHPAALAHGWMPPHPTLYLRRAVFERLGLYDTSYRIAGDYEAILRYCTRGNLRLGYIARVMVQMRSGGLSNRDIGHILRKSREDYRAIRHHKIGGAGTLLRKNITKISQFR